MQPRIISHWFTGAVGVAVVAALAVGATLAVNSPADAQTTPISCTGTAKVNFGPPLGPTPQDTTISARDRLGTFSDGDGQCVGPFDGAHAEEVLHSETSCLTPSPQGIRVPSSPDLYRWDNGEYSIIASTATTVTHVGGQTIVTDTGIVTDGFNQGAPATVEKTFPTFDVQECLESGVNQKEGSMTLTIG